MIVSSESETDYGGDDSDVGHDCLPQNLSESKSENNESNEPDLNKSKGKKRF